MRLIDADALREYIDAQKGRPFIGCTIGEALKIMVDEQPTIEPERKKGKWTPKEERQKQEIFICSECGGWAYSPWIGSRKNPKPNRCKYTFCPNCGSYNGGET